MEHVFNETPVADFSLSSVDLEAHVLSVLTKFPAAFDEYAEKLSAETFFTEDHKKIFNELCKQHREGVQVDALTLMMPLSRGGMDVEYLNQVLTSHDYSSRGIKKLVDDLVSLYKSRQLQGVSFKIAELAYEDSPR